MIYIAIDTCVWTALLKVDFHTENNLFDEICFWIENHHIKHIAPENITREWNRHKIEISKQALDSLKKVQADSLNFWKQNKELSSTYQPDIITEKINDRVRRIDNILTSLSVKAMENPSIIQAAGARNLACIAPNHAKDSFRDSINILTLINHIRENSIQGCYFTTINYKDFSVGLGDKHILHNHLEKDFSDVSLEYVYFDDGEHIGRKLFSILRKVLPSYDNHLKEKARIALEKLSKEQQSIPDTKIENPDVDFIENIKYIDSILIKDNPTSFEMDMMHDLINRHESYKQYFFKNLGNNGVV